MGLEGQRQGLQVGDDGQTDLHLARLDVQRHLATGHHPLGVHGAVGQDVDRLALQVAQAADLVGRHARVGRASVHKERIGRVDELARAHPLDVSLGRAVDRAAHHGVEHVLVALGHHSDGLESAVGVVLVPGADLLLGHVGQAQQLAVVGHEPAHRLGGFGVGHVHQVERVEQVGGSQAHVARQESTGLPVVAHLAHVATTGRAVEHGVVDDHRLHVVGADVGLGAHRDRGGRDRITTGRLHAPLGRAGQQNQVLQGHDVPDAVCLTRGHPETDRVVVARGQRVRQVGLGARAGEPKVLGLVGRAGKRPALLVIGHGAGVVTCTRKRVVDLLGGLGQVGGDVVVLERQPVGLADVAVQAVVLLVDVVAQGAGDRRPVHRVERAGLQQVVGDVGLACSRGERLLDAVIAHRGDLVEVVLQVAGRRCTGGDDADARGCSDLGHESDRRQGPVGGAHAAQLTRGVVGVHQGQHVRRLHVVDVEQIGLGVRGDDLVGRATGEHGAPVGVESDVVLAELQHHGLGGRERERDQAGALGAGLDLAHERKTGAVGHRAVGQRDEVQALGQARLVLHVVDATEELRRDLATGEGSGQGSDVGHVNPLSVDHPRHTLARVDAPVVGVGLHGLAQPAHHLPLASLGLGGAYVTFEDGAGQH